MKERVLVIAPHPDDEIIGCGGTMAQHVEKGDRIFVIYVTKAKWFAGATLNIAEQSMQSVFPRYYPD